MDDYSRLKSILRSRKGLYLVLRRWHLPARLAWLIVGSWLPAPFADEATRGRLWESESVTDGLTDGEARELWKLAGWMVGK